MDILAPTVETNTVEKVTFQYIISHENWIENRNDDGVCESLTVRVHGWTSEYQPPSKTSYHGGIEGPDYSHDSLYISDPFTVVIPEELQTNATFHNHDHDNMDLTNNENYSAAKREWNKLVKESSEYATAIEQVKAQLEAL
jgi:hypothetical protein